MLTQPDKARDLAERFGGGLGGEFAPSGIPISRIAEEYGTPFYLYHAEMISERVSRVHDALGTEVSYSVKANPSLGVCQLIASEREAGAEVASSGELAVARAAGYSFPSGHALNATLTAGVLLLVFLPYVGRGVARAALWVAALLLTVVTGLSRVALGVHFTSDVLGGWLLGVAVVAATTAAFTSWRAHPGLRPVQPTRDGVAPEVERHPGAV